MPDSERPSPLLPRIAAGDQSAVSELMDRYGDLLWSLARSFTRSNADAEEAVQDIFVCLWERADRYSASLGEEVTFVSVVARRRLIDRWRKESKQPGTMPDVGSDSAGDAERPVSGVIRSEDVEEAMRAISELGEDQRLVITLSIAHGLTHEGIADHTGIPLGTVKTHIRRGLASVRERLARAKETGRATP
ncbi:MAG: RNA polymerase sigma factor [Phycisphaeraceae bacterium]|nr:RNA polymerase sigma factor [Phycisphaeraceae bacterium]